MRINAQFCFLFANKHISTKKNFEMYLRAGKTKKFSVFRVENGKIQSMLWLYGVFQCRNTCNLVKNNFFYDLCTFSMKLQGFWVKKG